jgi:hypothetical protein
VLEQMQAARVRRRQTSEVSKTSEV